MTENKSSKFEYTGEFRLPKKGEYYYDDGFERAIKSNGDYVDDGEDKHRWRRPIMRKVEPLKMENCPSSVPSHTPCIRVTMSGATYHLSPTFSKDIFMLAKKLDNTGVVEYTESTGEECD